MFIGRNLFAGYGPPELRCHALDCRTTIIDRWNVREGILVDCSVRRGKQLGSLALLLALTTAACGSATEPSTAAPGDADPPAADGPAEAVGLAGEFGTLDGASLDLATLKGEDVVLWFWAPW